MKKLLLAVMLMTASLTYAQWGYDRMVGENGAYVIAYSKDPEAGKYLKMECVNGKIILYIQDSYSAAEAFVSVIFVTPKGNYEVKFHGVAKDDGTIMLLETDLANAYYLDYFKQATQAVVKMTFDIYEDLYYAFNMKYSTGAFNFMYNNRYL
jgi:hypothetical protein